jgi:hypothetical protein
MLIPLFSPADIEEVPVPPERMAETIQAYQKDLQTGLVEISLSGQFYIDLLFVRGQIVNVYKRNAQTERISAATFLDTIPADGKLPTLRAISLTPQAIRLAKILLEQMGTAESIEVPTEKLETQVDRWRALPFPGLVHIRWPKAEALALLTGSGRPPRHTIFIAANQILHSPGGTMALYGWKENTSTATYYSSESRTLAWQEYILHYSFVWMVGHLLSRFEQLTGRLLLNSVLRETNFSAAAHGLSISFAPGNVTDQTLFSSVEEAAQTYNRLLELIFNHVGSLIGSDLLASLIQESILRMQPAYRRALQENFSFTKIMPAHPNEAERTRPVSPPYA